MTEPVILISMGAGLIVVAFVGKIVVGKVAILAPPKNARIPVGLLGVGLLALGVVRLPGGILPATNAPNEQDPRVVLSEPGAGATLSASFRARGIATGLPHGRSLWLAVNPIGSEGWWPQGGPLAPSPPAGNWERDAWLGGPVDGRFRVAVVAASEQAARQWREYLERADKIHESPGEPLPDGATIVAAVEVVKGRE